jgi:hypothetical protein
MKNLAVKILIILLALFLFYSCMNDKYVNPDYQTENGNYFPNTEGSCYKYEIFRSDSNNSIQDGNRVITYNGDSLIQRTRYQIQLDSVESSTQTISSVSYFRTTSTGVFYFVDTTGISSLLPDSLLRSIDLQTEMRLFLFPFIRGNSWTVYRVSYNVSSQFGYNIINFSAKYFNDEVLQLNLNGIEKTLNTKKVKYLLSIQTDPNSSPQNYETNIWVADNIGIVKMQGSTVILGIFSGGGIGLSNVTGEITQNLVENNIK